MRDPTQPAAEWLTREFTPDEWQDHVERCEAQLKIVRTQ